MPHGSIKAIMPVGAEQVFELLHNYDLRLKWDTLLSRAELCEPWKQAEQGAVSVCTGRWYLGRIAVATEYVTFKPGQVAAVKMTNQPWPFETFAASIRHEPLDEGRSSIEYQYHFTARPRMLQWLLHPIIARLFHWETSKRLAALARYLEPAS